jgi:hypothetical protein
MNPQDSSRYTSTDPASICSVAPDPHVAEASGGLAEFG